MQVAISSLLFKSHPLGKVINLAREQGVSWLEVWSEHLWRDDRGDLVKQLRNSGLSLSVHDSARQCRLSLEAQETAQRNDRGKAQRNSPGGRS